MAVKSLRKIPIHVWIPPVYSPLYKIEIVGNDGTSYDVTDSILSGEIIDGVTDTIGNFNFVIENSSQSYLNVFTGNEIVNVYMDYEKTATTKRFRGRIEKPSYRDNNLVITGRSESSQLLDITVTKAYTDTEISVIIKELFDNYATDFTYANVQTTTTNVTVNWYQKPFWECIQELCHASSYDVYVDCNLDCNFFPTGSVSNITECIVHEANLMEIGDFGPDLSQLKNRVVVYGADIGDLPLIYTAEDLTSQASYKVKELIITDTNISTMAQAQERADYELELGTNLPVIGDATSIGLATIQPGEQLRISAPSSGLVPNYYKIRSYKHSFDEGFFETTVTIEKEPKKIHHLFKDRISAEQQLANNPNANEMRYSWNFDYDEDSGTHTNTQIINGVLQTTGGATGTWVSASKTILFNATSAELRVSGTSLSGTTYYLSSDNGVDWDEITPNTKLTFTIGGPILRIKVILNSASTQIDSLVMLYR